MQSKLTEPGRINRTPYYDISITNRQRPPAGPFTAVKDFHDWLSRLIRTGCEVHWPGYTLEEIPDPYRAMLPDNAEVVFTHSDLHPSNILV